MSRPPNAILHKIAQSTYSPTSPATLDGWTLIRSTPTMRFYQKDQDIIVGIRGTDAPNVEDLKADASIALGMLQTTTRYKRDLETLQQVRVQYPPTQYRYYGVGHSLGGAILDLFLKQGLLTSGLSYNPAVEPGNFQADIPNQRIYNREDPLYKLMGRHTKGAEVRSIETPMWKKLVSKIPYVGKLFSSYDAHKLDNFVGGSTYRRKFLKKYKLEDRPYSIAEVAEITGIPEAALQESYNRGIGAARTQPESIRIKGSFKKDPDMKKYPRSARLSDEQWGWARMISFAMKSPKVFHGADRDIAVKHGLLKLQGKGKQDAFKEQLQSAKLSPTAYLRQVRQFAKAHSYNPNDISLAEDGVHKVVIRDGDSLRKFGRVGYNDFILWSHLEKQGTVPKGTAKRKQKAYLARATKIAGDWKQDKFAPNTLAIRILWDGRLGG